MYCLPKDRADLFISKLKDGSINPVKLAEMSSEGRRTFFQTFMGETHAKHTNSLFESKLLLKNQQQGMITWAKTVSGMKPEAQRDILSRVNKMTEILNPASEKAFLEDLVAHKLQTKVTIEQANKIAELAKTSTDNKAIMENSERRGKDGRPTDTEMAYGRASVAFSNYVNDLKANAKKMTFGEYMRSGRLPQDIASTTLALKSTFDDSFIGRQGNNSMMEGLGGDIAKGKIWVNTFGKSFQLIWNTFGKKAVMDELNAEIISDPEIDLMKKAGVAIGTVEEPYQTSWPKKIPLGIGKIFEASENAFEGSAYYMRYKLAKLNLEIMRKAGIDLSDKTQLEGMGTLVNSDTGRGGSTQKPGWESKVLWAVKLIKANVNTLTAHQFDPKATHWTKIQARKNIAHYIIGFGLMVAISNAVSPGSAEKDLTGSAFGTVKIGGVPIDITGGKATYIRTLARALTKSKKDSVTGIRRPLNTGAWGAATVLDLWETFFENKTTPIVSTYIAHAKGKTFSGKKPTLTSDIIGLFAPISASNVIENKGFPMPQQIIALLSDATGFNSYIPSNNYGFGENPGVVLQQFKAKIGEVRYKKAEEEYIKTYNNWWEGVIKNPLFVALEDEDKQKVLTKKKMEIKADIFKHNFFKYKPAPTKKLPNF